MGYDLDMIKDKYGENMSHLCRNLFPTILETEGVLFKIISDHFDYSKFLFEDIINNSMEVEFKDFIFRFIDVEEKYRKNSKKTPTELLDEAGYKLFECKTEEQIQKFRIFYDKRNEEPRSYNGEIPKHVGEELCTFDGGRLRRAEVFFAVKKNVSEIKREDFKVPNRQDEYGTSVISIQFSRDASHTLSIKNRYNHSVNNPDATFGNNLDNIIEGLTESFEDYLGYKIDYNQSNFELPGYVLADDGKYYKYNYEMNNVYYCPNNVIIDTFHPIKLDKDKFLVLDYFILDLQKRKLDTYDAFGIKIYESFVDSFKKIDKIDIRLNKEKKQRIVTINGDIVITLDTYNRIIGFKNNNLDSIGYCFLFYNKYLKELELNNVTEIGDGFLHNNEDLTELVLPNVTKIGDNSLYFNTSIDKLIMPKLKQLGKGFMYFGNIDLIKEKDVPEEVMGSQMGSFIRTLIKMHGNQLITEEDIERFEREIEDEENESSKKRGL